MTEDECPNCSSVIDFEAFLKEHHGLDYAQYWAVMHEWLNHQGLGLFLSWFGAQATFLRLKAAPQDAPGVIGPWGVQGAELLVKHVSFELKKMRRSEQPASRK